MLSLKGVVDKILELVQILNGHFRNQRGRLPQKTPKIILFVKLDFFEKILKIPWEPRAPTGIFLSFLDSESVFER